MPGFVYYSHTTYRRVTVMLMQIRERASGILAYIIVILISIPFAFWGIQEYLGGGADQNVAEVNGAEITKRVFDNQLQEQKRYLKSLLGDSYDSLYQDDAQLKHTVLDNLIENTLLNDETKQAGYEVSNTQLFERIKSVPQFQNNGKFDQNRYEQLLAAQRRNKVEFEEQLRQEQRINQYQGSIVFSSFLPSADKERFSILKGQKRQFDYIPVQVNVSADQISDNDIAAYYESNKANFKTPAKVKLEYIEIFQQKIADSLDFSEDELLAVYQDEPDRYRSAELRKVSHILFKLDENASEQQVETAFTKANEAAKRIKNGEEFSSVAIELSEDSVSAKQDGNLGFLSRTDIDNPTFVDKLFSMQVADISEPVRTKLGVQIIRLEEITPSKLKPFAEVRMRIKNELRSQTAEQEFIKRVEKLQELSYEHEDTLSVAAENLDVSVGKTDWVSTPTGDGIGSHAKVISAAFSDDVLNKRYNSELLELADGYVAVIRVVEHQDAAIQSVEEVMDSIRVALVHKLGVEQSLQKGKELIAELQNGTNQIEDVAKRNRLELKSSAELLRDDKSVPADVLAHVFTLPTPQSEQPVIDGFESSDGKYIVIRLNKIVDLQDAGAAIEQAEWISTQGKYGRREMSAMLKSLRETGDVEVFVENL